MKCILFGGSGEVGGAVARAMVESDACSGLTLLGRRTVDTMPDDPKLEQVVVDTGVENFEELAAEAAAGHDVGISGVGIGSGSMKMSEEELAAVEVGLVGGFARGCKAAGIEIFELLTAVGVKDSWVDSRIMAFRVIGRKHRTVVEVGFDKLAIFRPGMIVGNAHTPRWVTPFTGLIPDALGWGNIQQEELAQAFVEHLVKRADTQREPVVFYGNKEMKQLVRE